jgi:hypothetical protein
MAYLQRIAFVGGETAGFGVPIFRQYKGGNQEYIQVIDERNNVIRFETISVSGETCDVSQLGLEAEVGDPAIWAFRNQELKLHLGNAAEIKKIGMDLVEDGMLDKCPMAAVEMVFFCQKELERPSELRDAYRALTKLSWRGADTWRDTAILLPAIKHDISKLLSSVPNSRQQIEQIIAVTKGGITSIYMPEKIGRQFTDLPKWRVLASHFDVSDFEIKTFSNESRSHVLATPDWLAVGLGGIARFVIERSPFNGSRTNDGGSVVLGPPSIHRDNKVSRLFVGIIGSNVSDSQKLIAKMFNMHVRSKIKHLINVRPIGFGTPSPRKAKPELLMSSLPDFDFCWLIANHRQRQVGNFTQNLTASTTASRFVRAAVSGLISCLDSIEGQTALLSKSHGARFGLVGATRYDTSVGVSELVMRALYSMICEDAYLHSAESIYVIWPRQTLEKNRNVIVQLGKHKYEVKLIEKEFRGGFSDVVAYAVDVELSKRTESDFKDFCISVLAGFGWNYRYSNDEFSIFENEGEVIEICTATSRRMIYILCEKIKQENRNVQYVITNKTVPQYARDVYNNINIVHYSELSRYMAAEYRMGLFRDL